MLSKWLGDARMLVGGGLLDQPAGEWLACQYAGWVDQVLDKMTDEKYMPKDQQEIDFVMTVNKLRAKHPEWNSD